MNGNFIFFHHYLVTFSQFLQPLRLLARKARPEAPVRHGPLTLDRLPKVDQAYDAATTWRQTLAVARFEARKMLASVFFIVRLATGSAPLPAGV